MDLQKEREAFEAWLISTEKFKRRNKSFLFMLDDFGTYEDQPVLEHWETWQAAKAESHKSASLYQWEINQLASANQQLRDYAAKAQAVPEQVLENDCMIGQTWFMKGTSVSALIKHAEDIYKAEAVAQNSKIEFGTDDNEHWFAHDVPFYGRAQIDRIEEHGLVEWDIFFNECWQGPFGSKSECIKHLEECIAEERLEAQEPAND